MRERSICSALPKIGQARGPGRSLTRIIRTYNACRMSRNVVLLFDGTWNNRQDKTNVLRLRESIDSRGEHDPGQPCRYLTGVGTSWHNWLTGGLFGRGLSENIQLGYAWLARTHR